MFVLFFSTMKYILITNCKHVSSSYKNSDWNRKKLIQSSSSVGAFCNSSSLFYASTRHNAVTWEDQSVWQGKRQTSEP